MKILVIDGQGGGMGKSLVERLKTELPNAEILALGTNAAATSNMLKGGADIGATGENPIVYNSRNADIIVGPIGIILPNAMYGEITPAMAAAVAGSGAELVLIPVSKCHAHIVGADNKDRMLSRSLDEAVELVRSIYNKGSAV